MVSNEIFQINLKGKHVPSRDGDGDGEISTHPGILPLCSLSITGTYVRTYNPLLAVYFLPDWLLHWSFAHFLPFAVPAFLWC